MSSEDTKALASTLAGHLRLAVARVLKVDEERLDVEVDIDPRSIRYGFNLDGAPLAPEQERQALLVLRAAGSRAQLYAGEA